MADLWIQFVSLNKLTGHTEETKRMEHIKFNEVVRFTVMYYGYDILCMSHAQNVPTCRLLSIVFRCA